MASPMHCLVCDCSAKSHQRLTPSAYGCQSRMKSQTPYRQKGRVMQYRKTVLLIRHSYSNWNINGTCTASSSGLPCLCQTLWQHRFHQRRNPCLFTSLPSRVSHTHHRLLTMIPVLRPCKRVVWFSRLIRHRLSCYLRLQISGLHKNTISHCRTGLLITVLRLLDSNQTVSSVKMVLVCGRMAALRQRHSRTDLATAHCFRHSASYRTPSVEGRTDAHQTVLLVARHRQRRRKWPKSCAACQRAKIHTHTKMPLERLPAPTKRFSHIHIDLVGLVVGGL